MNLHHVALLLILLSRETLCHEETEEDEVTRIKAELELIDWDLEDFCEEQSNARKNVLLKKWPYKTKVNLEIRYGGYLKNQTQKLLNYSDANILPEFSRNYTVLTRPGDVLLTDENWKTLVTFRNENEELRNRKGKREYFDTLSASRNLTRLKTAWFKWQPQVSQYQGKIYSVLQLVSMAASASDQYDSKAYWEMLTDYPDGYATAQSMWEETEPLYRKLHSFVLTRLNNYYQTNFTDIPVYLLGSNFGKDWSNIADIILPHPQIYHDVKMELQDKTIEDVYRLSEKTIGTGGFGKKFWANSVFNSSDCSANVLHFCIGRFAEVVTCDSNIDWSTYFRSHESSLKIGLERTDYTSVPRQELRYSILDDAVTNFASLFAVHNLPVYELLGEDVFTNDENASNNRMSALLLLALKVLPKLPYYLAADMWRLDEIERPSDNASDSWWETRKKYQGVEGISNTESDYMGDSFVTSNKPYLSKFFGVFLQFQILSYHQINFLDEADNLAERLRQETDFIAMIHERPSKAPLDLLSYNYGFDTINSYPLLEFFKPLEEYFDSAPQTQAPIVKGPKKPKRIEPPPPELIPGPIRTTIAIQETTTAAIPVQNDQDTVSNIDMKGVESDVKDLPKKAVSLNKESSEVPAKPAGIDQSGGMYIAITVGACLLIIAVVFVFKKLARMRRPMTNNRRFEA